MSSLAAATLRPLRIGMVGGGTVGGGVCELGLCATRFASLFFFDWRWSVRYEYGVMGGH